MVTLLVETLVYRRLSPASLLGPPQFPASVYSYLTTEQFTVVRLANWPLNGSEAGSDLALIQTSLLLSFKFT